MCAVWHLKVPVIKITGSKAPPEEKHDFHSDYSTYWLCIPSTNDDDYHYQKSISLLNYYHYLFFS